LIKIDNKKDIDNNSSKLKRLLTTKEAAEHINNTPFLTVLEAADYLRVPPDTFKKLVSRRYRKIPLMKIGRRIIFKKDLLDSWAESLMLSNTDL
jgi:excisionase family DNA binding protein